MLGDAAKGDLVINKVNKHIFLFEPPNQKEKKKVFFGEIKEEPLFLCFLFKVPAGTVS